MRDAMEATLRTHMLGSNKTTLLMRLAHLIKLTDMMMESHAVGKSSARIACQEKDVGLKKELRFTVWMSTDRYRERQP
jgi:hypothetical protein